MCYIPSGVGATPQFNVRLTATAIGYFLAVALHRLRTLVLSRWFFYAPQTSKQSLVTPKVVCIPIDSIERKALFT